MLACAAQAAESTPAAQAAESASPAEATLAWLRDGVVTARVQPQASSAHTSAALGSLWKLYVYGYLVETGAHEPAYQCGAHNASNMEEQEYCCKPGESVSRDQALARSCGAYFEPRRLGINAEAWRAFWRQRAPEQAPWLLDLPALQPQAQIGVQSLLGSLQSFPLQARQAARQALAEVTLSGYARGALAHLGSGPRMKTFTWRRGDRPDTYFGGAAGWLADGTPFWFGATGSSKSALTHHAAWIAGNLPDVRTAPPAEQACVVVDFFARYPISAVHDSRGQALNGAARLNGAYVVTFQNGTRLPIRAEGELELRFDARPAIQGRFALEDYVARVIDREGDAGVTHAARALAVLARSHLLQNAAFESGCYRSADSSNTQRVSPRAPSPAALHAAQFTAGLVLSGAAAQYHRDRAAPGRLAWKRAVEQAQSGATFDLLLAQSFPGASFATLSGLEECRRLDAAERWLAAASTEWKRTLLAEPGFEPLDGAPAVCALNYGNPYSDQRRLRIYARDWRSVNDQLTLAHEYLHLAFRFHPRGFDEAFIEQTARRLVQPRSGSWTRPSVRLASWLAGRDEAAGPALQRGATTPGGSPDAQSGA
jgi:uncharacterized protein YfaQ (DUF2300 family)